MNCVGLVLAAGGSRRLGQPKQLVRWKGKPLVAYVIEQLIEVGCDPVHVVVGSHASQVREELAKETSEVVHIIEHRGWADGQSTSLRAGLNHLHQQRYGGGVIVALCDQPWIRTSHYRQLTQTGELENHDFIATNYQEGPGVPACFKKDAWQSLRTNLAADVGAKCWMREQPLARYLTLRCDQAEHDIDLPSDLERLAIVVE